MKFIKKLVKLVYWSIELLPGLMPSEQESLKGQGIEDTQELLKRTKTIESKIDLASKLKLSQQQLNKWIALAELGSIPSVGSQYCGIVLHGGVASVAQLAQTPFHRLHRQVARLQVATSRRKDLIPPIELVKQWVEQAQILSRNP